MARPRGHRLNRDAWDDWLTRHLGTTITELSAESDIPRPTLSGIVGGFQSASVQMAHKLAAAMGCKVGTLFPTLSRDSAAFGDEAA